MLPLLLALLPSPCASGFAGAPGSEDDGFLLDLLDLVLVFVDVVDISSLWVGGGVILVGLVLCFVYAASSGGSVCILFCNKEKGRKEGRREERSNINNGRVASVVFILSTYVGTYHIRSPHTQTSYTAYVPCTVHMLYN